MSKPLRGLSLVWILGLALWVPSYGQDLSYELTIKDHLVLGQSAKRGQHFGEVAGHRP